MSDSLIKDYILDAFFEERPRGVDDWECLFNKNILRSSKWHAGSLYKGLNITTLREFAKEEFEEMQKFAKALIADHEDSFRQAQKSH